ACQDPHLRRSICFYGLAWRIELLSGPLPTTTSMLFGKTRSKTKSPETMLQDDSSKPRGRRWFSTIRLPGTRAKEDCTDSLSRHSVSLSSTSHNANPPSQSSYRSPVQRRTSLTSAFHTCSRDKLPGNEVIDDHGCVTRLRPLTRITKQMISGPMNAVPIADPPPRLDVLSEIPQDGVHRSSTFRTCLEKAVDDINEKYGTPSSVCLSRSHGNIDEDSIVNSGAALRRDRNSFQPRYRLPTLVQAPAIRARPAASEIKEVICCSDRGASPRHDFALRRQTSVRENNLCDSSQDGHTQPGTAQVGQALVEGTSQSSERNASPRYEVSLERRAPVKENISCGSGENDLSPSHMALDGKALVKTPSSPDHDVLPRYDEAIGGEATKDFTAQVSNSSQQQNFDMNHAPCSEVSTTVDYPNTIEIKEDSLSDSTAIRDSSAAIEDSSSVREATEQAIECQTDKPLDCQTVPALSVATHSEAPLSEADEASISASSTRQAEPNTVAARQSSDQCPAQYETLPNPQVEEQFSTITLRRTRSRALNSSVAPAEAGRAPTEPLKVQRSSNLREQRAPSVSELVNKFRRLESPSSLILRNVAAANADVVAAPSKFRGRHSVDDESVDGLALFAGSGERLSSTFPHKRRVMTSTDESGDSMRVHLS
ncbi:hypothetical protein CP533_0347, partial [Ophiocordyceps camponoti-saundersi (nom. inval.)]